MGSKTPRTETRERDATVPPLPDNDPPGCNGNDGGMPYECPVRLDAPSLAMVYSPKQCFRNLLDPYAALDNGTLFAELILPFRGGAKYTENGGQRPHTVCGNKQ